MICKLQYVAIVGSRYCNVNNQQKFYSLPKQYKQARISRFETFSDFSSCFIVDMATVIHIFTLDHLTKPWRKQMLKQQKM